MEKIYFVIILFLYLSVNIFEGIILLEAIRTRYVIYLTYSIISVITIVLSTISIVRTVFFYIREDDCLVTEKSQTAAACKTLKITVMIFVAVVLSMLLLFAAYFAKTSVDRPSSLTHYDDVLCLNSFRVLRKTYIK